MKRRVVGVDITAKSIRAVQMLHRAGQRSVVEKFIEFPLEEFDPSFDASKAAHLARQLREVWITANFKTKDVVFGVGGGDVFVRELITPDLPKGKLKKALPDLVKSELPMPVEDIVLDYYANARFEVDGEAKLGGLLVAANRAVIDGYMEAARANKFNVLSIDLIPFALTRNFSRRMSQAGIKAYVRAANSFINIVVTDGPLINFVRLVPWNQSTAGRPVLPEDGDTDSKGIFLEFADTSTSEIAVMAEDDHGHAELHKQAVRELEYTMSYFQKANPGKLIEEVLVSGYRLDNPAFIKALSRGRDVQVTGITRSGLGHKRSTVSTVENSEVPDHLAVALALAEGVAP